MKYIIITPAYNEEQYISILIESVLKQTIKPQEWIIVNDGSSDRTAEIVEEYSKKHPWIRLHNNPKSKAPFGSNVILTFMDGLSKTTSTDYHYIAKLDADLNILRKDYFEYQLKKMDEIPNLGISSGITFYIDKNGDEKTAWHPKWRTSGALKFYRRNCLEQIGGLIPVFGWDGIDEYKAMYNGWKTITFYELRVHHLAKHVSFARKTSKYYYSKGESLYIRGFPIEFIFLKSISWVIKGKFSIGLCLFKGYFEALRDKKRQLVSPDEKKFIRKFQYCRLINKID